MALRTFNRIDLCSGIGMLGVAVELGSEFYGVRSRCVAHVERDAYAAAALVARMEDSALDLAPVWDDLESFKGRRWRGKVDCLAAGFPCQPWSSAGKGEGIDDERWLWPTIARIVRDTQPAMVFLENVPGLVSGGGLHFVLDDLAESGFDAEWLNLRARSVGASHQRERTFVLAFRPGRGFRELWQSPRRDGQPNWRHAQLDDAYALREQQPQGCECGIGGRTGDAGQGLGNAGSPREGSKPARSRSRRSVGEPGEQLGDAESSRSQWPRPGQPERRDFALAPGADGRVFAPGPAGVWGDIAEHVWPAIEPGLCVLADGMALVVDASRADQLRCGGNGVVAIQGAAAFIELVRRSMTD